MQPVYITMPAQQPQEQPLGPPAKPHPPEESAEEVLEEPPIEGAEEPVEELPEFPVDEVEALQEEKPEPKPDLFPITVEGMLGYMENLSRYLREPNRRDFLESEMRLRIDSLRVILKGKTGLLKALKKDQNNGSSSKQVKVTQDNLKGALQFFGNLTEHHPDREIAVSLKYRMNSVLSQLRSLKNGNPGSPDKN